MEFRKDTGTRTEIKDTGISRKVDELGRIVLPIELRRSYGIEENDKLDISVCEAGILLSPPNKCFCCGTTGRNGDLAEVNDTWLCHGCLSKFNKAKKEGAPANKKSTCAAGTAADGTK